MELERIKEKLKKIPRDIRSIILYEFLHNPKKNYSEFISNLKKESIPICGEIDCRFRCFIHSGKIYHRPFLVRSTHKTCYCGETVFDYDFSMCHKHAIPGTSEYEIYHMFCKDLYFNL